MDINYGAPLWNTELPVEERIGWLLENMTLEEKISWIPGWCPNLERLGIPGSSVGGEAAHGVQARNDQGERGTPIKTTSFVQPVGMSATWDPALLEQAGNVTGTEARIIADMSGNRGLSRWAPTVDLERDPRWGRTEEGYGEDPFLTGKMAGAYVRGIQGPDPDHLLAASTLKHFYGNNTERGRGWKSDSIDPRNKWESYLKTFINVIREGHPEGIMTAYNRINGIPGIMNPEVRTVLKDRCGLQHAVGDGGAATVALNQARQKGTGAEIVATAIKAGVDSMTDWPGMVLPSVREALEEGLLTEADLDKAISNMMRTKIRLGLYDKDQKRVPHPDPALLASGKHGEVCRRVSEEAMVLLKNDAGILPLDRKENENGLTLIGPWADEWRMDWYGGLPAEKKTLRQALESEYRIPCTVFDGFDRITLHVNGEPVTVADNGLLTTDGTEPDPFILEEWGENNFLLRHERSGMYVVPHEKEAGGKEFLFADKQEAFSWYVNERFHFIKDPDGTFRLLTRFERAVLTDENGVLTVEEDPAKSAAFTVTTVLDGIEETKELVSRSATTVFALGCHPMLNAKEEEDRNTLELPERQIRLIETARADRDVTVFCSNYPYAMGPVTEHCGTVLWTATGAQDMGLAVAETLFGDNAPAGRLNMTWYRDDSQLSDMDEYDLVKGRKTYRYFDGQPMFPFGHGLTYTAFRYDALNLSVTGDTIRAEFTVTNTGDNVSDEVVQLYWSACDPSVRCPFRQLAAFERLHALQPGETRNVCLQIPVSELAVFDPVRAAMAVRTGEYRIRIGASSADIRLEGTVVLQGEKLSERDAGEKIFADSFDDDQAIRLVPGQYQKDAVTAAAGTGILLYERCRRETITDMLCLRVLSKKAGKITIRIDGTTAGSWEGSTLDYHAMPVWFPDEKTRLEEPARIAMQEPVWCDVMIPLATEQHFTDGPGLCDLRIELEGDVLLNWFRCIKKRP